MAVKQFAVGRRWLRDISPGAAARSPSLERAATAHAFLCRAVCKRRQALGTVRRFTGSPQRSVRPGPLANSSR
jgi:hypothetical protein